MSKGGDERDYPPARVWRRGGLARTDVSVNGLGVGVQQWGADR